MEPRIWFIRLAIWMTRVRCCDYHIGYRAGLGGFNGLIDEVRIYDGAMTVTQVSNLASIIPLGGGDLVGHWELDEGSGSTTGDSSGHGNDGTLNLPAWTTGVSEYGLEFDGGDYVMIPGFSELSGSSGATIAFAAKQYENAQRDYVLWASGNVLIEFGASGNTDLRIRWNLGGTWSNSHVVQGVLDTNRWHHWAFTFNQGTTAIYKDGVEIYTGLDSQTSISAISPDYHIGYRAGLGGFNGVIDEIRIYNGSLSSDEIQYLYENP